MTDFRAHAGWCPNGAPPDGRRRLDIFPDWADAFPLWERGNGCVSAVRSASLRADLQQWNRDWERQADTDGCRASTAEQERWLAEGERLARRVEAEADAVVVLLGPERFGPARDCPNCGRLG